MEIFRCILVSIVHLILLGKDFLVVGTVVEHQVGDDKAGHLLVFAEMDHHVSHHLQHLSLPRLRLGPQFLLLQVADAAIRASIQMPVMEWNNFFYQTFYCILH